MDKRFDGLENNAEIVTEMPLCNELLTTVRLMTGSLCSSVGIDVDYTEDVKVCVTEGLLLLKRSGFTRVKIVFRCGDEGGLACSVFGVGERGEAEKPSPADEISLVLLSALVKKFDVKKEGNVVSEISFSA